MIAGMGEVMARSLSVYRQVSLSILQFRWFPPPHTTPPGLRDWWRRDPGATPFLMTSRALRESAEWPISSIFAALIMFPCPRDRGSLSRKPGRAITGNLIMAPVHHGQINLAKVARDGERDIAPFCHVLLPRVYRVRRANSPDARSLWPNRGRR